MKIIDQTSGQLGMALGWYNASASANAATNAMYYCNQSLVGKKNHTLKSSHRIDLGSKQVRCFQRFVVIIIPMKHWN